MPTNLISSICLISKIPQGSLPPFFKQKTYKNQQIAELKDITRLFILVSEQEKNMKINGYFIIISTITI